MSGPAPPHITYALDALDRLGVAVSQNGDATVWLSRCPRCEGAGLQTRDVDWGDGNGRRVRFHCPTICDHEDVRRALGLQEPKLELGAWSGNGHAPDSTPSGPQAVPAPTIVTLEAFVAVDEPGATPLLGDEEGALIAEGSDVMVYGNGGAGKTTLLFDLAFHLAAGRDWLGFPISRPSRVLLIENEGPRPLLRNKLKRKLEAWDGPALDGRVSVFEEPWGRFSFAEPAWRKQLADTIRDREVDVIIAGPLTRLGMDTAGTLPEVAAFMRLVDEVRQGSGRGLTPIIAHHENKSGAVSGAWEGAGDTLLHVEGAGNGHTLVYIAKARWASAHHHKTLKLAWTDGESFELEGDRDYVAEVRELLSDRAWRTAREISGPTEKGGIGAAETTIKTVLDEHPEQFELRTGPAAKALGRLPTSKLWGLSSALNSHDSDHAFQGGAEGVSASASALKDADTLNAPPTRAAESESEPQLGPDDEALADWGEQLLERHAPHSGNGAS